MNKDEIIKIAKDAGFVRTKMHGALERFANLIAAAEREACAEICDSFADDPVYCGELIRARGQG
jgi:hypothetical protein